MVQRIKSHPLLRIPATRVRAVSSRRRVAIFYSAQRFQPAKNPACRQSGDLSLTGVPDQHRPRPREYRENREPYSETGRSSAAVKYSRRSSIAIGCAGTLTHFGVIIIGRRFTSERIISNERLPGPISTDARNSSTGTPDSRRIRPTSWRLSRCADNTSSLRPRPPR